jgi:hypothetical protein
MLRPGEMILLTFDPKTTGVTTTDSAINLAMHATADIGFFRIPFKCEAIEAGAFILADFVGASIADAELKFDLRPTIGSDTNRGDGDIADLNFGTTGASEAGKQVWDIVAQTAELITGQGVGILLPGNEVVVQNMFAGTNITTGKVWPYLLVRYIPEVRDNLAALTETA